jgi:hypothetical protein
VSRLRQIRKPASRRCDTIRVMPGRIDALAAHALVDAAYRSVDGNTTAAVELAR